MGAPSDDLLDYYACDLGPAQKVALTVASDHTARLAPGRYLVQFTGLGANVAWLRAGPYSASSPVVATADVPSTPFLSGVRLWFEINVRKGHNDQLAAIMNAATGTMIVTPLSRQPKRA